MASGLGGALWAPVGLVKDLATAPFVDDDEYDGFVNSIYQHTLRRGGRVFQAAMGPEEGLGAAIGGLPKGVRDPAKAVIDPVLGGLETAGREAVREPLTALMTAASLQDAGKGFNLREGYRIAQNRSLGQAIALGILTDDITDEVEVAKAMGSDWYENISGTMDAVTRLFLEPDVILGASATAARRAGAGSKLAKGARALPGGEAAYRRGIIGRTIKTGADREAILVHPGWQGTKDRIMAIRAEAGLVDEALPEAGAATPATRAAADIQAEMSSWDDLIERLDSDDAPVGSETVTTPDGRTLPAEEALEEAYRRSGELKGEVEGARLVEATGPEKEAMLRRQMEAPNLPETRTFDAPNKALPEDAAKHLEDYLSEDRARRWPGLSNFGRWAEGTPEYQAQVQGVLADLPDELVVFRGDAGAGIGGEFANVTLKHGTAERFTLEGWGSTTEGTGAAGKVTAYRVNKADVVAIGAAPHRELIFRTEALRPVDEAAGGAAVPPAKPLTAQDREAATNRASAKIRDLMFHDHAAGGVNARVLAEADDLDEALRVLTGDREALASLADKNVELAGQISRDRGRQAQLNVYRRREGQLPFELEQVELAELAPEVEALYQAQDRTQRAMAAFGTAGELPRITGLSEVRHGVVRSQFFQKSHLAAPLRLATTMRPHGMVALHDARGDVQVSRFVKKAGLDAVEQDRLRGAYMAAANPSERNLVLVEAETVSIRRMAERHGIDPEDIDRIVAQARMSSDKSMQSIRASTSYDAEGKFHVISHVDDDGVTTKINVPGAVTQEFNYHALPDLDALEKVFAKQAELSNRFGAARVRAGQAKGRLTDLGDDFYKIWKPSVLLRAGWPIRVVGEEQLRIMAKIGALTTIKRTGAAAGRYIKDRFGQSVSDTSDRIKRVPMEQRMSQDLLTPVVRGQRIGTTNVRNWEVQKAYGAPGDVQDVIHGLNSSRSSFEAVILTEKELLENMGRQATDEWRSIAPDDVSHASAWVHAVNNQIGKDVLWRQFLEGQTVDAALDWLHTTPAGQAYAQRMKHWRGAEEQWLTAMKDIADDYVPTDELRRAALDGKATYSHLERAVPDMGDRPPVHGAVLAQVEGKGFLREQLTKIRDKSMKALGQMPTDILSRHPYFDFMYTEEINRMVNVLADQGAEYTPALARDLEGKARQFALSESKKLLYDLAEQSEMAHMLRFVSPFYSAWQEVLTRWSGIAVEQPAFVARMHQIWQAPERAGVVVDENGNRVDEDGRATDNQGNRVEAGADRFISMAIPQWAINDLTKNIPGVKGLEGQGGVRFNKEGFNLVLQGAPGVGPLVQVPINEIVKGKPELEDSLKWALPFGTTQETMDMLLPATAKRIKTRTSGEEDRVYRNTVTRLYFDGVVDFNLGKREDKPTYAEAKKKADSFYNMRAMASFISPVAPQFVSPYQIYIDAYRNLKEADEGKDRFAEDYRSPDDIFLEQNGAEFFPLTQSLSKSMDGIPPTLEGAAARKKYQDMIEAHPELGGLIVGAEGAGEFSRAVYDSQLAKKVGPGSADLQRQALPFEEAAAAPNVRLGWMEYGKAMDLIDAEMFQRGLPNLRVKAARDLAGIKRQVTGAIAAKYPEWFNEFGLVDRNRVARRVEGMREIAADDRLAGRDDIAGLRDYLAARDAISAELTARAEAGGAKTLDAVDNEDLDGAWEQLKTKIVERNLGFGALYHRWLTNDVITAEEAA